LDNQIKGDEMDGACSTKRRREIHIIWVEKHEGKKPFEIHFVRAISIIKIQYNVGSIIVLHKLLQSWLLMSWNNCWAIK
jgi:hypothetical protein